MSMSGSLDLPDIEIRAGVGIYIYIKVYIKVAEHCRNKVLGVFSSPSGCWLFRELIE